jgi:hypothetical protein
VAVEAVSAASVEPIYAGFGIRSTAFCNFISLARKNRGIPPFFSNLCCLLGPVLAPGSGESVQNHPGITPE